MWFRTILCIFLGLPVWAQEASWPDLGHLLFSTLTVSGTAEAAIWLPDHPDPGQAGRSLGVVYEHIPGSAGNATIAVGYYRKTRVGWSFLGKIEGIFGHDPRAPAFQGSIAELTTTMLGPNDPRCCPTQPTRWRINLATRQAQRLN